VRAEGVKNNKPKPTMEGKVGRSLRACDRADSPYESQAIFERTVRAAGSGLRLPSEPCLDRSSAAAKGVK
jgi:hypothetical protein